MYKIRKRLEISASHSLSLDYESKCQVNHGHNWIVIIHCRSDELDQNGMVVDFSQIKTKIHGKLDHQSLNSVLDFNPTAENIAKWVYDQIQLCYRVEVQESEGNWAVYEI